jgi:hypothetical protein
MFEAVEALAKRYEEMKSQLGSEGQESVKAMFRVFFETHSDVEAVRWTQYTPHFNDGDPCTFSVCEAQMRFKGDENWLDSWSLSSHANGRLTRLLQGRTEAEAGLNVDDLEEDFSKLNQLLQSDTLAFILDAAFGDGYEVTATRESITAEHYDHD